jgi:hypothetical protein
MPVELPRGGRPTEIHTLAWQARDIQRGQSKAAKYRPLFGAKPRGFPRKLPPARHRGMEQRSRWTESSRLNRAVSPFKRPRRPYRPAPSEIRLVLRDQELAPINRARETMAAPCDVIRRTSPTFWGSRPLRWISASTQQGKAIPGFHLPRAVVAGEPCCHRGPCRQSSFECLALIAARERPLCSALASMQY